MGLAADINYRHPRPNPVQRAVQSFASTTLGAWTFSKTLPAMDRGMSRLTNGRTSLPRLLAALPVLVVTSTGRKSGLHRGITRDIVARPATEDEREQVLANSTGIYSGYVKYQQRITGRRLRIFVLEPASAD